MIDKLPVVRFVNDLEAPHADFPGISFGYVQRWPLFRGTEVTLGRFFTKEQLLAFWSKPICECQEFWEVVGHPAIPLDTARYFACRRMLEMD